MLKLALLSTVALFAIEGAVLVSIAPHKVERLAVSTRVVHVSAKVAPAATTPKVEVLVLPPLDVHANRPHNANRKVGRLVCGPSEPMVGVPNGGPHAAYGRVARCEVM